MTSARNSRRGRITARRLRRAGPLRGRGHLLVLALTELLDDLLGERRDVVGVAARHETLVDVDLLVDPVAARVADVGLDRRERREGAALHDVGLDEGPRAVADRADRLGLLDEGVNEAHRVLVRAQEVRVRDATGKQQRVEVRRVRVLHGLVYLDLVAVVEMIERLYLARLEREVGDLGALLLEALDRLLELDLLDAVGEEHCDLLAV